MGWLEYVRREHRKRKRLYALATGITVFAYVGILFGIYTLFWVILDIRLPIGVFEHFISGIIALGTGLLTVFGPKPVSGKEPPEYIAAKAFRERRDVRADDNHFEDHKP